MTVIIAISLFVISGTLGILMNTTITKIVDDGKSTMTTQSERTITDVNTAQVDLFTTRLGVYVNIVKSLGEYYKKTFDSNFPYVTGKTYYSGAPKTPLSQYYGLMVSYDESTYHYPGIVTAGASILTTDLNTTRDYSFHLTDKMKSIFDKRDQNKIVNTYIAFTNDGFRIFPGQTMDNDYAPTARSWYTCAMTESSGVCITGAYRDANSGEWMITVSHKIVDDSENVLGVIGVDILIQDIRKSVSDIVIYDSGSATLLHGMSGDVVADAECPMTVNDYAGCTYDSLVDPAISMETWNTIRSINAGKTIRLNTGAYLIIAQRIERFNDFYFLLFLPTNKVTESIDRISNDIDNTKKDIGVFIAMTTAIGFVIVLVITFGVAKCIAHPVESTRKKLETVRDNLGHGYGLDGVTYVGGGIGRESNAYSTAFNRWIDDIRNTGVYDANKIIAMLPEYGDLSFTSGSSSSSSSDSSSSSSTSYSY
jgi:hypothetical protein